MIICQEDGYLRELVRYIHLDPVRAGIVAAVGELNGYSYSGQSALMGKKKLKRGGYDVERIAKRVAEISGVEEKEVFSKGRQQTKVRVRSLL